MILFSTPLDGSNYLWWSWSMKITLGAKDKLGLIDGKIWKTKGWTTKFDNGPKQTVWQLLGSWIHFQRKLCMSSYIPHILGIYGWRWKSALVSVMVLYCINYRDKLLWFLKEICQLCRIIQSWDGLNYLMPLPLCTCGATKAVSDLTFSTWRI